MNVTYENGDVSGPKLRKHRKEFAQLAATTEVRSTELRVFSVFEGVFRGFSGARRGSFGCFSVHGGLRRAFDGAV